MLVDIGVLDCPGSSAKRFEDMEGIYRDFGNQNAFRVKFVNAQVNYITSVIFTTLLLKFLKIEVLDPSAQSFQLQNYKCDDRGVI